MMQDYNKLVEALRICTGKDDRLSCSDCPYHEHYPGSCRYEALSDAAAAIEELDAEETRLLLLTSDLQDKLMDLQEQLNDSDVAAEDNGRQIEELQAEVKRLQLDNEDYEYEHRRLKGEIEALQAEVEKYHDAFGRLSKTAVELEQRIAELKGVKPQEVQDGQK